MTATQLSTLNYDDHFKTVIMDSSGQFLHRYLLYYGLQVLVGTPEPGSWVETLFPALRIMMLGAIVWTGVLLFFYRQGHRKHTEQALAHLDPETEGVVLVEDNRHGSLVAAAAERLPNVEIRVVISGFQPC